MSLTHKQISLVHVAKTRLGLSDEEYRDILMQIAGVTTSKDLDDYTFDLVMKRFVRLGFRSSSSERHFGYRPGMASPAQVGLIRKLWDSYTDGEGTEQSLGKWLGNKFKISALRFLPAETAPKVITALRAMNERKRGA